MIYYPATEICFLFTWKVGSDLWHIMLFLYNVYEQSKGSTCELTTPKDKYILDKRMAR